MSEVTSSWVNREGGPFQEVSKQYLGGDLSLLRATQPVVCGEDLMGSGDIDTGPTPTPTP